MSTLLQVGIACLVSIFLGSLLYYAVCFKFKKPLQYVLLYAIYIIPFALCAFFIGETGFFFSKEYIVKNIFTIITCVNLVIAIVPTLLMLDFIFYQDRVNNKMFWARVFLVLVLIIGICEHIGFTAYSQIDEKNNSSKTPYSIQEPHWNSK